MKKLISIVIPLYNEKENVPMIHEQVNSAFESVKKYYDCEFIFVNDGSQDSSWEEIEKLAEANENIRGIDFSRNFGKEIALTAGIQNAEGDAVISLDVDGQHPPNLIPEFLEKWSAGAKVVVGVRKSNQDYGPFKRFCSKTFYKFMNLIGETKMMPCSTDFRLLDRQVVDEFKKLNERNRITRSLIDWLGFKRDYIAFEAPKRIHGDRQYSFVKLVRLAMNSFVSNSLFPLKVAGYLGVFITLSAGLLGFWILLNQVIFATFYNPVFSGIAMMSTLLVFLVGIVLMALGLIALYVGNIHQESLERPLYIVNSKIERRKLKEEKGDEKERGNEEAIKKHEKVKITHVHEIENAENKILNS